MGSESDDAQFDASRDGSPNEGVAESIADAIAGIVGALGRRSNGDGDGADVGSRDDDTDSPSVTDLYEPSVDEELADHRARRAVLADARQAFADSTMAEFAGVPTDEAVETRLFDFSYLHDHEEVDRYWVNEPFAYVSVLEETATNDRHYRVTEPVLDEYE
ncbi:MAG: hypothetical protein V5A85_02350 [Haloarculaceae archaeon]